MQSTSVFVLFWGLVSSVLAGDISKDDEKRLIRSLSTDTCVNKLGHCAQYGQWVCSKPEYTEWAKENCAKMCNLCSSGSAGGVPTPPLPGGATAGCTDKLDNCDEYQSSACTTYKAWASENCAKTCNLCGNSSSGSGSPGTSGLGWTSGCVYKSQVYQQGQTWNEDCKYKCECVNGVTGYYQCRVLCWKLNLPSTCHMNPPVPGECCATPVCPPSVLLNYPSGYSQE